MSTPVSAHFSLAEFACKDGTPYPIDAPNDDDRGATWFEARLLILARTLEIIRAAANAQVGKQGTIHVNSAYRSPAYNRNIGSHDTSQHPKGRAVDITHSTLTVGDLHALILKLYEAGQLPDLGGLGFYPTFVHCDVRPRPEDNHLARWMGSRTGN